MIAGTHDPDHLPDRDLNPPDHGEPSMIHLLREWPGCSYDENAHVFECHVRCQWPNLRSGDVSATSDRSYFGCALDAFIERWPDVRTATWIIHPLQE
jgi:hypothetical protein